MKSTNSNRGRRISVLVLGTMVFLTVQAREAQAGPYDRCQSYYDYVDAGAAGVPMYADTPRHSSYATYNNYVEAPRTVYVERPRVQYVEPVHYRPAPVSRRVVHYSSRGYRGSAHKARVYGGGRYYHKRPVPYRVSHHRPSYNHRPHYRPHHRPHYGHSRPYRHHGPSYRQPRGWGVSVGGARGHYGQGGGFSFYYNR